MKTKLLYLVLLNVACAVFLLSSCSTTDMAVGSRIKKVRVKPAKAVAAREVKKEAGTSLAATNIKMPALDRLKGLENHSTIRNTYITIARGIVSKNTNSMALNLEKGLKGRSARVLPSIFPGLIAMAAHSTTSLQTVNESGGKLGFGTASFVFAVLGWVCILTGVFFVGAFLFEALVYVFSLFGLVYKKSTIDVVLAVIAMLMATGFWVFVLQGLVN